MTISRTISAFVMLAGGATLFFGVSVVSAQTGAYDYDPNDPTACWADPYPSDAPNYTVDCDDPACDIGPCAVRECWYDPARDEPARLAPSFTVSCSDPRCNVGPCVGTGGGVSGSAGTAVSSGDGTDPGPTPVSGASSAGAPGSTGSATAEPVTTHSPEWTNLNESDPGATQKESGEKSGTEDINIGVGELQEGDAGPAVTQRNESDMEFVRERAAESSSQTNIFIRIWNFFTGWW